VALAHSFPTTISWVSRRSNHFVTEQVWNRCWTKFNYKIQLSISCRNLYIVAGASSQENWIHVPPTQWVSHVIHLKIHWGRRIDILRAICLSVSFKSQGKAVDVLLTRMIPIQRDGISETSIALRSLVKFHFKLGPEYYDANFYVAAHHWAPLLMSQNYKGYRGNRHSRQFKNLLTRLEAGSYNCSMEDEINNFESCMNRAGVLISRTDQRRLLFAQGPTNTLSIVRSCAILKKASRVIVYSVSMREF
jgi:hypothetical protein